MILSKEYWILRATFNKKIFCLLWLIMLYYVFCASLCLANVVILTLKRWPLVKLCYMYVMRKHLQAASISSINLSQPCYVWYYIHTHGVYRKEYEYNIVALKASICAKSTKYSGNHSHHISGFALYAQYSSTTQNLAHSGFS